MVRVLNLTNVNDLAQELARIGVDSKAWDIFSAKLENFTIKIEHLPAGLANILKQTALALGADCAQHRQIITGRKKFSDVILFANLRQLKRIGERLSYQPFSGQKLARDIIDLVKKHQPENLSLKIGKKVFYFAKRTYLMGILNITPDSFSDGGRYLDTDRAIGRAEVIEAEGADLIDLGAESTRPGSKPINPQAELSRLIPVLRVIRKKLRIPISVDTYKSEVAKAVLSEGADMINDISGLNFDKSMAKIIAKFDVPCIIMHIKGKPKSMQKNPRYKDTMSEIYDYLANSMNQAQANGINPKKIIIDPGIGFGKRLEDNYMILRRLSELKSLGRPIMVGPSRKSFIGMTLNLPVVERLEGTIAASVIAIIQGANLLRVHDVAQVKRAALMTDAIKKGIVC
jgi:dihydropteroate synthase